MRWIVVMLCALACNSARADAGAPARGERLTLGLDLVLGGGETITLGQADGEDGAERMSADVEVLSLVAAAEYAIAEELYVGLELPLSLVRISPAEDRARTTFAPGNLVLEGEHEIELSSQFELSLALVVALPTATGTALPSRAALAGEPALAGTRHWEAYDAYATHFAATSVRGHEEDPLFVPNHLGLVPTISADYQAGLFALHAYLELENLINTRAQGEPFIAEIDVGVHARYRPIELFEAVLKVWTNAGFIGESDFIAALEPQLRFHLPSFDAAAGVILPFAGERLDTSYFGLRLVAAARL